MHLSTKFSLEILDFYLDIIKLAVEKIDSYSQIVLNTFKFSNNYWFLIKMKMKKLTFSVTLVTFQMLSSSMWLVATTLETAALKRSLP